MTRSDKIDISVIDELRYTVALKIKKKGMSKQNYSDLKN